MVLSWASLPFRVGQQVTGQNIGEWEARLQETREGSGRETPRKRWEEVCEGNLACVTAQNWMCCSWFLWFCFSVQGAKLLR